jgi:hypothetical protein
MHKVAEIDVIILIQSKSLHDVLLLFYETVVHVNEKDANNELLLFFSYIIANRQCHDLVLKYLDIITVVLICSVGKEQGSLLEKVTSSNNLTLLKIANALVVLINNAEMNGSGEVLKQAMYNALAKSQFAALSERVKHLFVSILFAFKSNKPKIRLALVNFHGLVNGILGEDSLLGLELEALKLIDQQKL